MSKRFISTMPGIQSITGKLCRVNDTVSKRNPGWRALVGYTPSYSIQNCFQFKMKPRVSDLSAAELAGQANFKTAVANVAAVFANPTQLQTYKNLYEKSEYKRYKTLRGFVFAEEYAKL